MTPEQRKQLQRDAEGYKPQLEKKETNMRDLIKRSEEYALIEKCINEFEDYEDFDNLIHQLNLAKDEMLREDGEWFQDFAEAQIDFYDVPRRE